MRRLKVLLIHWEDITETSGWYSADGEEEANLSPAQCYSTGIKIKETKSLIYIANTFGKMSDGSAQWGTISVIPKGCIRKMMTVNTFEVEDEQ